eukprot:3875080-Rhodomonas_salina.1
MARSSSLSAPRVRVPAAASHCQARCQCTPLASFVLRLRVGHRLASRTESRSDSESRVLASESFTVTVTVTVTQQHNAGHWQPESRLQYPWGRRRLARVPLTVTVTVSEPESQSD